MVDYKERNLTPWLVPLLAVAALVFSGIWLYNRGNPSVKNSFEKTTSQEMRKSDDVMSSGNIIIRNVLARMSPGDMPRLITFREIGFENDTANLKPTSIDVVDDLAEAIRNFPYINLQLQGHTDGVGNHVANKELSLLRAAVVRNLLVAKGIDINRLEIEGIGDEQPIASSDTDEGRALNRRIEVVVIHSGSEELSH